MAEIEKQPATAKPLAEQYPELAAFAVSVREVFGKEAGGRLLVNGELVRSWGVMSISKGRAQ